MKNIRKYGVLVFLLQLFVSAAFSQFQQGKILKVLDEMGNPIHGASMEIDNSESIIHSDGKGVFSLTEMKGSESLKIFADGFESMSMSFHDLSDTTLVQLDTDSYFSGNQNEIFIPFDVISRRQLTGSVSVIRPDDLDDFSDNQSIMEVISGLVPGFYNRSLRGRPNYLVVVDGIPRSSLSQGSTFSFIDNLSMQEVEQITLLKDASSAMMFGTKAADGVIMITTKRGEQNRSVVNARAEYGIRIPVSYPKYLSAGEYMRMYNQASINDGFEPRYSQGAIDSTLAGIDPVRFPDEGFYNSDYLNNYASSFRFSAEASGGNDKTLYYSLVSWNHDKDLFSMDGNGKGFVNNQLTFRGNVKYEIKDWLSAKLDAFVLFGANRQPSGNFWADAATHLPNSYPLLIPVSELRDSALLSSARLIDEKYILGGTNQFLNNIYGNFTLGGYKTFTSRTSQLNFGLDFDLDRITQGLKAEVYLGYDIMNDYILSFDNEYAVYERSYVPRISGEGDSLVIQKIGIDKVNQSQNLSNPAAERRLGVYSKINYTRKFNEKHTIHATGLGFWNTADVLGEFYTDKRNHFGLRGNYMYNQKWVVQLTSMVTGSGYLPQESRYKFNPSAALGYIISEENFLKNLKFLDYLKLKASYGKLFTDMTFPAYYIYNSSYSGGGGFIYNRNLHENSARVYNNLGNPDIGMVSRNDLSLGFEAALLNNFIWIEADLFISTLDGGIVKREDFYPEFIAILPYENYEKYRDKGIDMTLSFRNDEGDFKYNFGINATYIIPEAIQVEEPFFETTPWRRLQGQPYDVIFGYVAEGLFSDSVDIASHASQAALGTVIPGDIKYKDLNNDGLINQEDQQIIGNSKSRLQYGISINLSYKRFSLFALGTGQSGGEIIFNDPYYWPAGQNAKYSEEVLGSWTSDKPDAASYPVLHLNSSDNNYLPSTYWIEKNNWFSLHTMQISYSLVDSESFLGSSLQVYLRGNNLFMVSPIRDKLELNIGKAPQMRTFALGVDIVF